ncbi:MAG: exo-alpha-sialidase [Methanobacteriota archaeon]|nr:MAG: exo-alpha-sialidase [Euryarchaeota archaeon]TLZ79765.1 MAG: exo-alpha-sialidase [Euryarchaeota archaeon]
MDPERRRRAFVATMIVVVTLVGSFALSFPTSGRGAAALVRRVGPTAFPARTFGLLDATASGVAFTESPIAEVSQACDSGQNAEVEQAVDAALGYVYETWMGCQGIAFARSTDGGLTFDTPLHVPESLGSNVNAWDPAVAVSPDGTVYAAFMIAKASQWYPVVAASFDHGSTFAQVSHLVPPDAKNWGDRDFIAVGPDGTVYVTYDYGPERTSVTFICTSGGSCAFATGDLNVVIQWSTDHGKTWGPLVPVSPGFPASGGDSAPLWVEPNGRIDLEYQGYTITNTTTYTMTPAHTYFTSSADGGATWSSPVRVGPADLTMSLAEWWIDGSLGIDAADNLYTAWDTQGATEDIGWLSFSTDHGATWSPLVRVTPDSDDATHITEVAGGGAGIAYVGWLSNNATAGWAFYVRAFSVKRGWLTPPIQVSTLFGDPSVWPGDTFGISTLGGSTLVVSWGSGITIHNQPKSQIFAAALTFHLH